jgi:hypothetical protein
MDISGKQLLGSNGSLPASITFLSISQRLKESFGASIAETEKINLYEVFLPISVATNHNRLFTML